MTTFNQAGITEVPKSLDDLMAAGKAFRDLGTSVMPALLKVVMFQKKIRPVMETGTHRCV